MPLHPVELPLSPSCTWHHHGSAAPPSRAHVATLLCPFELALALQWLAPTRQCCSGVLCPCDDAALPSRASALARPRSPASRTAAAVPPPPRTPAAILLHPFELPLSLSSASRSHGGATPLPLALAAMPLHPLGSHSRSRVPRRLLHTCAYLLHVEPYYILGRAISMYPPTLYQPKASLPPPITTTLRELGSLLSLLSTRGTNQPPLHTRIHYICIYPY
jgi:hypothetical protein